MLGKQVQFLDALTSISENDQAMLRQIVGGCKDTKVQRGRTELPGLEAQPGSEFDLILVPRTARIYGWAFWGKVVSSLAVLNSPKTGKNEYWINVFRSPDRWGFRAYGPRIAVLLPTTGNCEPCVEVGDVLPIGYADDGTPFAIQFCTYTCTSPPPPPPPTTTTSSTPPPTTTTTTTAGPTTTTTTAAPTTTTTTTAGPTTTTTTTARPTTTTGKPSTTTSTTTTSTTTGTPTTTTTGLPTTTTTPGPGTTTTTTSTTPGPTTTTRQPTTTGQPSTTTSTTSTTGTPNPCPLCVSTPSELRVDLSEIVNLVPPVDCSRCGEYNGTYFLELDPYIECHWMYTFPSSACGSNNVLEAYVTLQADGHYYLDVYLQFDPFGRGDWIAWSKDLGTTLPNCVAWSNQNLPFLTGGIERMCDGEHSQCLVSAV